MYVWEFFADPRRIRDFEFAYGQYGDWVKLFRTAPGYIRTELHHDLSNPLRYLTIDYWESREAWEKFRARSAKAFEEIDARCESLTTQENDLGRFEPVG
jgi:heme-degrading monooxygenase HmoA